MNMFSAPYAMVEEDEGLMMTSGVLAMKLESVK